MSSIRALLRRLLFEPMPPLERPMDAPFCPKCGARRPPHPHASWTERDPR